MRSKAEALVSEGAVSTAVSTGNQVSERVLIEATAKMIVRLEAKPEAGHFAVPLLDRRNGGRSPAATLAERASARALAPGLSAALSAIAPGSITNAAECRRLMQGFVPR